MARTEKEILNNIAENIKSMDSSVDTTKGPLYNFVMAPVAPVVRNIELASDRVERLLSLDIVAAENNAADIEAFGNNFRVPRGGGHKERHLQTFYLFSNPTHVRFRLVLWLALKSVLIRIVCYKVLILILIILKATIITILHDTK